MKDELEIKEYKLLGNTVEDIAIKYGIFLSLWAGVVTHLSQSSSITSWIPGMIGAPLVLLAWLSKVQPKLQKVAMHFAVFIGFLGFVGGFDIIRGGFSVSYAGISKLMLFITGFLFCFLCVQSFRYNRRQKKELERLSS